MAAKNDGVKHAILALASTYLLDYLPNENIRGRANYHYKRAAGLLGQSLRKPESHEIGKEGATVAILILLNVDDVSLTRII